MIYCCVKNCDTDENVVNCTSVFFVSFPQDFALRNEWLNVLACNDSLPERTITDATKICSCHFGDEAFGKHPVHGYRFLLPSAVPSAFSPALEKLPTLVENDLDPDVHLQNLDACDLVDDESNLISQSEVMIFQTDEQLPVTQENQEQTTNFVPANVLLTPSVDELTKPPKAIGIEYADGKYYFLQSEDESDDDLVEQVGHLDCESASSSVKEDISSLNGLVVKTDEYISEDNSEFEMIVEHAHPKEEYFEPVEESDPLVEEETPTDAGSIIEENSVITTSEFLDVDSEFAKPNIEYIVVKKENQEEDNFAVEVLEENSSAGKDTRSVITDYGTVEMLDDMLGPSACREKRVDKHFCQYCKKGFPYESGLRKHVLVHTGLKPHVCDACGKSFSQKVNLTIHLRRHTGEEPLKKFTCPICQKRCIRMSELKIHLKSHWKKLPHACPLCTERFSDITNYYEHLKSQHKHEITLQESIDMIAQNENAELIVPGEDDLSIPEDGFFTCTVCLKPFRTERMLRKHKRKLHPKVFVCASCPKQFLYKSLLDKHARVHTQEKPFKCDHCDTCFSQKVNLEVHLNKKHNIYVRDSSQRCFICEFCNKRFDRPSALQVHIRTHTKERPFACRDCPKAFVSNSALAAHIKTNHRGESILLQSFQRNQSSNAESIILEEKEQPEAPDDIIEEVEQDDIKFIQYSIQFINPLDQEECV